MTLNQPAAAPSDPAPSPVQLFFPHCSSGAVARLTALVDVPGIEFYCNGSMIADDPSNQVQLRGCTPALVAHLNALLPTPADPPTNPTTPTSPPTSPPAVAVTPAPSPTPPPTPPPTHYTPPSACLRPPQTFCPRGLRSGSRTADRYTICYPCNSRYGCTDPGDAVIPPLCGSSSPPPTPPAPPTPPTPPTPPPVSAQSGSSGSSGKNDDDGSTGTTIGILLAVVAVLAVAIGGAVYLKKRGLDPQPTGIAQNGACETTPASLCPCCVVSNACSWRWSQKGKGKKRDPDCDADCPAASTRRPPVWECRHVTRVTCNTPSPSAPPPVGPTLTLLRSFRRVRAPTTRAHCSAADANPSYADPAAAPAPPANDEPPQMDRHASSA